MVLNDTGGTSHPNIDVDAIQQRLHVLEAERQQLEQALADLEKANTDLQVQLAGRAQPDNTFAAECNLLRVLIDNLPDAIYVKDTRSRLLLNNVAHARMCGAESPEACIGKSDFDLFSPDLAEKYFEDDQAVMSTGVPRVEYEEQVLDHVTNTLIWAVTTKLPLRDKSGQIVGLVGTSRNVTERRTATAALEQERRLLRTLIDHMPDYIYVKDDQGRFLISNQAHNQAAGQTSPDALIGKTAFDFFPPALAPQFHADDMAVIQSGQSLLNAERVTIDQNGQPKYVLTTKVPFTDSQQRIIGLVGISRDITKRKWAEEALAETARELKRSNEELQQFAYVASHDLQEPLRTITSYLQLLEKRYQDQLDADAHDFIGYAVDGAARMKRLIHDLLAYSRVATQVRSFELVDCELMLLQALLNLQVTIQENQAEVTYDSLPTVVGDSVQLATVFQNLIGNAIKFHGDQPPHVHVSAEKQDNFWCFSVKDNGIGFAPEYAERVFVIFGRLHSQGRYPGTGIGLAICKRVVERHGGRIWAESQPDQGSTFYFTLPA